MAEPLIQFRGVRKAFGPKLIYRDLNLDVFLKDEEPRFDTMGGFMMNKLGEVPSVSDTLEWQEISFKVIKMDGQRVARLLVELDNEAASKITGRNPSP